MRSLPGFVCGILLAACSAAASAQTYSMLDLASLGPFPDAFAYGISQNGKITGVGTVPATGELHAFVLQNGVIQDLGMLGYPYGADGDAINNVGQVAATGYGPGYKALLWTNGTVKKLGGGGNSEGLSINNLGHIVGKVQGDDGGLQGFLYSGGQMTPLSLDIARCINDADQFVGSMGFYWTQGGVILSSEHAYLDSAGVITDLGSIGGGPKTNTEAFGLNSLGQVTGYSTAANGSRHAFMYGYGELADLGTIPPYDTIGVAINDSSQVAGNIVTFVGGQIGAFVYTGGAMHDLTDLLDASGAGWSQLLVTGMSNDGWIVGYGAINGETHGFLARPTGTWTPLGAGLAGSVGVPLLGGTGLQTGGSAASLVLTHARPLAPAMLFVSLANTPTPFKGGTLFTIPLLVTVPFASTGAAGAITLPFTWPAGLPSGFSLDYQFGIQDAAAVQGVALSNALQSMTP